MTTIGKVRNPPWCVPPYADIVTGLIAWYKFDGAGEFDGVANHVIDSSGNSYNGRAFNGSGGSLPTIVSGKIGNAGSFLVANKSFVQIASSPFYAKSATSLTIAFWLKPVTLSANTYRGILGDEDSMTAIAVWHDNRTSVAGFTGARTNALMINIKTASGNNWVSLNSALTDTANYHHWAITYNGSAAVKIYKDAVLQTVETSTSYYATGNLSPKNTTFQIGCMQASEANGTNSLSGVLDDVRFYSRALPLADIQALYSYAG